MKQVDNSKYNNDWFIPTIGASFLKQLLWYFTNVLFFVSPLNPSSGLKTWLLKCFGARLGKGVVIKPSVNIKYPWKLSIGNHAWIGEKVWIDNLACVHIGSSVCISQGAMLLTGNHDYKKTTFDLIVQPITIEDGAWIGARSLVGPGVVVETHAVLAAQSVASKNLSAYKIYRGNPAVLVRERTMEE